MEFISNSQPARKSPVPLVDPERKLALFWMHRCGSTSGQLWFFHAVGWGARIPGKGASGLSAEWYEMHKEVYRDLRSVYEDESYLKIAVVRNPLSRVVSAFSVVTDTITGSQWRAVSRSLEAPDSERRLSFNEFLDFLSSIDLARANYHWRLQTAQDCFQLGLSDVNLVRMESLQPDLDKMAKKLGIKPISIGRSSATTKLDVRTSGLDLLNMTRQDFAEKFGRDKRGVIRFPDYSRFLTSDTNQRIANLYRADFDGLAYPLPL